MLMFNKNNTLKKAFSQSVIQTSKIFLTTVEEEPTDQPPVLHFDPGAPLSETSIMLIIWPKSLYISNSLWIIGSVAELV